MNLVIKPKGTGKTIGLIYTSETTGYPIITKTRASADDLLRRANELGCTIPPPITITEVKMNKKVVKQHEAVLVDDLEVYLGEALKQYFGTEVLSATLNYHQ